ncbi:MAG: 50S ribosomal protein L18 [Myxococcales bacterium]|jgi:large subunit ribosomal protein L18|nr:50S ribosomal protein L18 [Myxococcales bacterium]
MQNRENRLRRKKRIRAKISGSSERPRLSIFRSARHIYVQVIDDEQGTTLVSSSTLMKDVDASGTKIEQAKKVGAAIAKACLEKGIEKVVFDRNGFLYHGRVRALAESAREAGLNF